MTITKLQTVAKISNKGKNLLTKHRRLNKLKEISALRSIWRTLKTIAGYFKHAHKNIDSSHNINNLIIVFRHVYINNDMHRFPQKSRPNGFTHLSCLKNLVETILSSNYQHRVKLFIYYNGSEKEFLSDQASHYLHNSGIDACIKFVEAKSAIESVLAMFESIGELTNNDDDLIYILENDYIHAENWIEEVFDIYSYPINFDYLSLYDHPDRYKYPLNYRKSSLYATGRRHWVTAPSTCGTFFLKKSVLDRDFHLLFSTKNDHQMFCHLTQKLKRVLITPVPGLAVHCMNEHLDPIQRFEKYFIHEKK